LIDKRIETFLDEVAAKTSAPGGGAVAAVAVAMAAALTAMVARFSEKQLGDEAERIAGHADELRAEVGPLAQADADAYGAYLAAKRLPEDDPQREAAIEEATIRSADVPLSIAKIGSIVLDFAADLSDRGNPNLSGDAYAAQSLAKAGMRIAANLVILNLDDPAHIWVEQAQALLAR
jgi:formiminotetrahydrofolate cyclodeaminase